jgi:hypothetical protein
LAGFRRAQFAFCGKRTANPGGASYGGALTGVLCLLWTPAFQSATESHPGGGLPTSPLSRFASREKTAPKAAGRSDAAEGGRNRHTVNRRRNFARRNKCRIADSDRATPQRGIVALLDRRIESVHVDVDDFAHCSSKWRATQPIRIRT